MTDRLGIRDVPRWYTQRVYNDTFMGVQVVVRDCGLGPEAMARYVPGAVLREPGYTYASSKVGGMTSSHRIAILTNHMIDAGANSTDEKVRERGLCVGNEGSRFKVLDVYAKDGRTQVLLLHLVDDERWRLFADAPAGFADTQIAGSRKLFERAIGEDPVEALQSDEWHELVAAPLGLDMDGRPWPVDIALEDRLKPMGRTGFREIIGSVMYVQGVAGLLGISGEEKAGNVEDPGSKAGDDAGPDADGDHGGSSDGVGSPTDDEGTGCDDGAGNPADGSCNGDGIYPDIMAYGYVNPTAGLCLQVLCPARLADGELQVDLDTGKALHSIRAIDVEDHLAAQVVDRTLSDCEHIIAPIEEAYSPSADQTEVRMLAFLDGIRSREFPDDIEATLYSEDGTGREEQVRIRLCWMDKKEKVHGLLLDEPVGDFGVHRGTMLELSFADDGSGVRAFASAGRA